MDETRYHAIADATLMHCADQLETAYDAGTLEELDLHDGILTMLTPDGATYLITKHSPSRQLWLASPRSGGLHFSFQETERGWFLPNGKTLYTILCHELSQHGIAVIL